MLEVIAPIEIDAPAEVVWRTLTDLARFREWNPFIRGAAGSLDVGGVVRVRVRPARSVRLFFRATVTGREENRELRWRGHVVSPRLADGDHTFTIEPLGGGRVRFVQHEVFRGVLPAVFRRLLEEGTARGFSAMNRALKERAERARRSEREESAEGART